MRPTTSCSNLCPGMDIAREYLRISRSLSYSVKMRILLASRSFSHGASHQHTDAALHQSAKNALRGHFPSASAQQLEVLTFYLITHVAIGDAERAQSGLSPYDSHIEAWEGKRATLNEMEQERTLKMQMAMERFAKFQSTLSNMMKKVSDTSSGIVSNLK